MKYLTCLLLSLSAGFATYAAGAVAWSVIDPDGAGAKLLFTIPVAVVGMTVPGIVGLLCVAFRCEFIREPKPAKTPRVATTPVRIPASANPPAHVPMRPTRTPRPATAAAHAGHADDDMELALAT